MALAIESGSVFTPFAITDLPDVTKKGNSTNLTQLFGCSPEIIHEEGVTIWINFGVFCQKMNRLPVRVRDYFRQELTSHIEFDYYEVRRLIIKGLLEPATIEEILHCYIADYVTCNTCNGLESELKVKDKNAYSIECKKCHSARRAPSVPSSNLLRVPVEFAYPNGDQSNNIKPTANNPAKYQNSIDLTEIFGCPEIIHEEGVTIWADFGTFCQKVNRLPFRVRDYFHQELTLRVEVEHSEVIRLVIRDLEEPETIEEIMHCYIADYIICNACTGLETEHKVKDKKTYYIKCKKCHCVRTAPSIPSSYLRQIPMELAYPNGDRSKDIKPTACNTAPRPATLRRTPLPY